MTNFNHCKITSTILKVAVVIEMIVREMNPLS